MKKPQKKSNLVVSDTVGLVRSIQSKIGKSFLFLITSLSTFAVFFIFYFIFKDAIPFFQIEGFKEFFTSSRWYPSGSPAEFGALSIFVGSGLVVIGSILVSVPLGIAAAVCLSDLLPFKIRQIVKPLIEMLAAIPSVAYGFFALVVFAPLLQNQGGIILCIGTWLVLGPLAILAAILLSEFIAKIAGHLSKNANQIRLISLSLLLFAFIYSIYNITSQLLTIEISSGTNALNVSIILGIMALPTIVSVSEDALQSAGRELREGSYALGATRAETILKTVIPASLSGILAAVILGIMRAIGETMVVWMASGNASKIPTPWYNILEPIRTLTATIAGDMGEADHVLGSSRFHVLFAMAFCLLAFSFIMNLTSEIILHRSRKKTGSS
ncbi:MAG TPA: phosphate ABC transporter permease [Verrucomicrobia bacterium]|nr:phosphate ABC transporter permease [Kiritimatiellaceae bacterium]HBO87381.1 phosphate ABC transporter permease [Verrucomicrobiota bacterium]|tara:strand:+ start:658 stop:1809 length:1152 start_codon:yes stop_codon:yes gene_type:complete